MAQLDIAGSFIITIGQGRGPETWVVVSTNGEDGSPFQLPQDPDQGSVEVFVALSPMFGAFEIRLRIVEFKFGEPGFCALRVEAPHDLGVKLEDMRPSTLGIVVEAGGDRGQALACSCKPAEVSSWFGETTKEP